jgi:hypothetical protein
MVDLDADPSEGENVDGQAGGGELQQGMNPEHGELLGV